MPSNRSLRFALRANGSSTPNRTAEIQEAGSGEPVHAPPYPPKLSAIPAALGPHTTGIVDGRPDSGDATSSSGDLSPGRFSGEKSRSMEEGILPDASRWGFRVSPGGWARAEGGGFESAGSADVDERKRKREGEESEDVLTSREKRQCASFRWNTGLESRTAPASLESERTMEVDGRKIREGDTCWVKLDFPEDAAVSSVTVQILDGQGRAKQDDNPIGSLGSAVEAPVPLALSSCGLKDVDGSIERTEALLGAVLGGWGSILKSTPPSKLLTRPPVRFLYDLFRAVARETGFGTEVISSDSTWEELTGKREKLQLMDSMVRHVSDTLGLKAPPARGSDIIVGKECSATNRFLQLLALAAHDHRQRATQRVGSGDDNGNGDGDGDGEVDDCSVNDGTPGGCSAWTRRLRVEVSRDGDTWEALLVAEASEERTRERFATWRTSTSTATRCRSMRLTVPALGENRSGEPPDRGADDGHGECSRSPREARPALIRVGVEGLRDGAGESKRRRQRRRRHTRGDRGDRGDPEAVDSSQGREKLDLKEEVLRLTADIGRERVENTSITEKLAQAELRLDEDKAQLSELEALKIALHGEADDLQNQVEVLIEERDIARSNEEELFARLMEKNEDLEALQESYVSLTDRYRSTKKWLFLP